MAEDETWPARDYVQMFVAWREKTSGSVQDFVWFLAEQYGESVGELMTDSQFQAICDLEGLEPDEAEDVLMSQAWP